jgi:hypothetical protein
MGIKKYIFASIVLILAIAGYVFSFNSTDFKMQIFDLGVILPLAIWVVVPAIILFIATLLHMFYYGLKNYLINRTTAKDFENIISAINSKLLNKEIKQSAKSEEAKEIVEVLSQLDITVSDANFSTTNKILQNSCEKILNINSGKYISSKDLKLPNTNEIMENNINNRIDMDSNFAIEVLKEPASYSAKNIKYAFMNVLENKSMDMITKHVNDLVLDADMLKAFVAKDAKETDTIPLDNGTLLPIIKKIENLSNKDLIEIAKSYKTYMSPEQLMKLFEDLIVDNEKYTESYLYVLSQFEMIDDIREILVNSQKDEYLIYKAYLDLRDAGKHYSLDTFI